MKNEKALIKTKNLKPLSTKELSAVKGGNGTSASIIGVDDVVIN